MARSIALRPPVLVTALLWVVHVDGVPALGDANLARIPTAMNALSKLSAEALVWPWRAKTTAPQRFLHNCLHARTLSHALMTRSAALDVLARNKFALKPALNAME